MGMAETGHFHAGFEFRLTMRQRRLRVLTMFVILLIGAMVAVGVRHPFFRSAGSPGVRALAREAVMARRSGRPATAKAERARRAAAVRVAFIGAYWSLCFMLSGSLLILAWLDVREIRRGLMEAQRAVMRDGPFVCSPSPPRDSRDG